MSFKRQGNFPPGTPPILQPGAKWTLNSTGSATRDERYLVNTVDFPTFVAAYFQIRMAHPTIANFWLQDVQAIDGKLGLTQVDCKWEGITFDPSSPPPQPVYYLNGSKITSPIDTITSSKWDKLVTRAGGVGTGKVIYDDNGKFLGFGKDCTDKKLIGLQTFDDTALVYRVEFVTAGQSRSYLSKLQKIATPPGFPPSLTDGRNWKLSNMNERSIGGSVYYEYSLEYEASGEGGWDTDIYN